MIKYVDNAPVTDEGKYLKSNTDGSIPTTDTSLQDDADHCLQWSAKNKMGLNTKKTFEMLWLLPSHRTHPYYLQLSSMVRQYIELAQPSY